MGKVLWIYKTSEKCANIILFASIHQLCFAVGALGYDCKRAGTVEKSTLVKDILGLLCINDSILVMCSFQEPRKD